MKKTLILLTNAFPYGDGEPYLETEVAYYDVFDKVYICSLQIRKDQTEIKRCLPSDKFTVIPVWLAAKVVYFLYAFVALFDKKLYLEVAQLVKQRRFSFKRFVKLFIFVSRSHYEAKIILKDLKETDLYDSKERGVIYSYRFDYQPYVGLLIQKHLPEFRIVARGHRYDLYEEQNSVKYIPMREILMEHLDKIIMISNDGANYLTAKYPKYSNKIIMSRLGTLDHGVENVDCPNGEINIVSCSYVVPVKRLDKIVASLQLIKEIKVNWTHFGDGECLKDIKHQCEKLPNNVHCEFKGQVSNREVLKAYTDGQFHLFLNVSSSEGVPVSIMEAMSYGIPCIATDVGGTKEILDNKKNGLLLHVNFSPEELAHFICSFAEMNDHEYQSFRKNSRSDWEKKCNAEENYREFINFLCNL